VPILVISATDYDGRIGSGMGSRFQAGLLAEIGVEYTVHENENSFENSFVGHIQGESFNG
jgi:hypothetical protein